MNIPNKAEHSPFPVNPEDAYNNEHVTKALQNLEWLTPGYIIEVNDTEPDPEREENFGKFKDSYLGDFFIRGFELGEGNETYQTAVKFVSRGIVPQSHILPLNSMRFFNSEIMRLAEELGVPAHYELDRSIMFEIDSPVMAIIAPEHIRRKVVATTLSWNEGDEKRRKEVLLLSQLVRVGLKAFQDLEHSSDTQFDNRS